jgi:hypothetical protein
MHPAMSLMAIYILITAALQFGGYLVSRVVDVFAPSISLMTFIVIFLSMFGVGWPIAVRITAWLIPETEAERRDRITNPSITRPRRASG